MRKFLELTLAGNDKKLYIPSDSIRTYEEVPEGKNPEYPNAATFLRYDYGAGLMFALVMEPVTTIYGEVGDQGWVALNTIDDSVLMIRNELVTAIQEKRDEDADIDATEIVININGSIGSLIVKNPLEEIKPQLPH